jgi:hypothetical protein
MRKNRLPFWFNREFLIMLLAAGSVAINVGFLILTRGS